MRYELFHLKAQVVILSMSLWFKSSLKKKKTNLTKEITTNVIILYMVCFCIPNISSKGAAVEEMSIPDWLYAVKKYNLNYDGMKRVKNGGDGRIVIKSGFAVWQEKKI